MPFWILLLTYLGTFLLSELLRPKPNIENARPAGKDEFDFPTATEGRHVPIVVGKVQLGGPNVIWYGDIEAHPITERVRTGLFSKTTITKGYEYFAAIQMALCRGPIEEITKIWQGEKIIFDRYGSPAAGLVLSPNSDIRVDESTLFGGADRNGGMSGTFEVHVGETDAAVSEFLSTRTVPTPNYQNTCYVIFRDGTPAQSGGGNKAGGYIGNSPNVRPFKFEVTRYPNTLGLSGGHKIGEDANPICFLYELLTDTDWGLGINPNDINLSGTLEEGGLIAVANQISAEGLGFSAAFENPNSARELIGEIERHVDGFFRLNIQTGRFEIILARSNTASPDPAVEVDESNIVELTNFSRGTWSETENEVRLTYSDRSKDYNETHALAQDMANRLAQGRSPTQLRYPGIKTASVANKIVWRDIRSMAFPLAKIAFIANRTLYSLQAGDTILWSWEAYGIVNLKMRITRVGYGTDTDSRISIDAVEDVYNLETVSFVDPPVSGWVAPVTVAIPLATDEQRLWQLPIALMSSERENDTQQVGTLAVRPTNLHTGYVVLRGPLNSEIESEYSVSSEVTQYTPSGELVETIARADPMNGSPTMTIRFNNGKEIDRLESHTFADLDGAAVNLVLIGNEVFFFTGVVQGSPAGTWALTGIRRGMLHTVPQDHSIGERLWFFTYGMGVLEGVETESLVQNETGSVKFLTHTTIDQIPFASAIRMNIGPAAVDLATAFFEFEKPYPPNDVYLNNRLLLDYSVGSPEPEVSGSLTFDWKGRNNQTQVVGQVGLDVDQNDAHINPSTPTRYRIRIYWTDVSPYELTFEDDDIVSQNEAVSPASGGPYVVTPAEYLPAGSPTGSPNFPKEFDVVIDAHDPSSVTDGYSQMIRERIRVTG